MSETIPSTPTIGTSEEVLALVKSASTLSVWLDSDETPHFSKKGNALCDDLKAKLAPFLEVSCAEGTPLSPGWHRDFLCDLEVIRQATERLFACLVSQLGGAMVYEDCTETMTVHVSNRYFPGVLGIGDTRALAYEDFKQRMVESVRLQKEEAV